MWWHYSCLDSNSVLAKELEQEKTGIENKAEKETNAFMFSVILHLINNLS